MFRLWSLPFMSMVLVAGLVFPTLSPYTAAYCVVVVLLVTLVGAAGRGMQVFGILPYRIVWASMLCLLLASVFYPGTPGNLLVFVMVLPVLLAPAVTMLLREQAQFATPLYMGFFCFAGAAGAAIMATYEIYVLGEVRAGGGNISIHFGGLALVLGFLALLGLFGTRSNWRFLFLLGPALGIMAALLSGSRGPTLAAFVLLLVVAPFLTAWFWRETVFRILLLAVCAGLLAGTIALGQLGSETIERAGSAFADTVKVAQALYSGEAPTDTRIKLYAGAARAFAQSPFYGHGLAGMMKAVEDQLPEDDKHYAQYDHLHSDIADFGVIGGALGLLSYVLLVFSPLSVFLLHGSREARRPLLLGGVILSVSYLALGSTNAMFGVLPQTTLFAVALGLLAGLALPHGEQAGQKTS